MRERRSTRGSGTSTTAVCTSTRPPLIVVGWLPRVRALKMVVFPDCGSPIIPRRIGELLGKRDVHLDRLAVFDYTLPRKPEWRNRQTRTTQNRVPSGVWVRFPPSAHSDYSTRPLSPERAVV